MDGANLLISMSYIPSDTDGGPKDNLKSNGWVF